MITTTAAGRTWHFDRSLGRPTNEHNGTVGGFRYPTDLAIAPGEIIFVLNKGYQITEQMDHRDNGRIGKTTLDEHHLGDFARKDFTWPGGIAPRRGRMGVRDGRARERRPPVRPERSRTVSG